MSKRRLNQYGGPLTSEQIAQGMNAARRNAKRLLEDASLLLESKRFPSAAALAVLAIEEDGKVSILRELAVAKSDSETKKVWHDYRSHTKKNVLWILPDLVAQGARSLDELRPVVDDSSDHPFLLDQIKQISFYTDCLGNARWLVPDEVIDEPRAKMFVDLARIIVQDRKYTTEEIDLWIEHLGPVWNTTMDLMKQALVNWHNAMRERGLLSDRAIDMEKFVNEGIGRD